MKKILCFALLVLVFWATGMCAAEVPTLLGNWTALGNGWHVENGSTQLTENQSLNITISEQKDRLFAGNMTYMENGTEVVESFAGAIGLDDKTLYIAESNEGYDLGTIISDNDIELIYLQDGKMGDLEIEKLHRIKA